ncbi:ATP-binding protein [Agromyces sp. ZXT2-3]|uniref:ATP-binding protein n=1 Tax=Agromyces sp. ZXT2-3 TaxID=3461152 RepID=UPI004055123E
MERRWVCLAVLGPVGVLSLGYVVVVRGFIEGNADHGLAWPILGGLPLFVFGMWLLTVSSSLTAVFVALSGTGFLLGSAYETFIQRNTEILAEPWFPLFNAGGLTADGLSAAAFLAFLATFPDGVVTPRWLRVLAAFVWLPLLAGLLTLLTVPHVVMSPYIGVSGEGIPNPYAVPALEWAAPLVESMVLWPWPAVLAGLTVLGVRSLFGPPDVRAGTRVIALTVGISLIAFILWTFLPGVWGVELLVYASLLAMPIVAIHGIFRHGAFDIAPGDRGRFVARSSNLLITVLYGVAVATPALLLSPPMRAVPAVLTTTAVAIGLLPVRTWLQRRLRRALFGDRDRQLEMLARLGTQLEHAGEPRELLARLAESVRRGLDATWVRIHVAATDGAAGAPSEGSPNATSGEHVGDAADHLAAPGAALPDVVAGRPPAGVSEPAETCDLVHGDEVLGRIEVGPRRRGEYSEDERTLLRTVAGQAAASVANVALAAQLAAQLDELTASRERLVAAQDDERRRLERDLHDGIQQDVVAQIAALRLARNRLERGELTAAELSELQDQARATLTDLRELARGIHPTVLSDNGLVAAVESGVARFPIPLEIDADAALRTERFADDVETTAYYVVREALANTAKHAHAAHASVGLSRRNGTLRIAISDDGCGIDEAEAAPTSSHGGLANIRDRVAALRGTMRIAPNAPSGTTVLVELPVGEGRG